MHSVYARRVVSLSLSDLWCDMVGVDDALSYVMDSRLSCHTMRHLTVSERVCGTVSIDLPNFFPKSSLSIRSSTAAALMEAKTLA